MIHRQSCVFKLFIFKYHNVLQINSLFLWFLLHIKKKTNIKLWNIKWNFNLKDLIRCLKPTRTERARIRWCEGQLWMWEESLTIGHCKVGHLADCYGVRPLPVTERYPSGKASPAYRSNRRNSMPELSKQPPHYR